MCRNSSTEQVVVHVSAHKKGFDLSCLGCKEQRGVSHLQAQQRGEPAELCRKGSIEMVVFIQGSTRERLFVGLFGLLNNREMNDEQ